MIVKNESAVITRCLASVKPLIDYWVIVDTGSHDGTQKIIQDFMKDVPGELFEHPWLNFEHNRNEALKLAKDKADYILFIDADEVFQYAPQFAWPELKNDFYFIVTEFSGTKYGRVQLVKSSLAWRWKGVLHEAIDCVDAKTSNVIPKIVNFVRTDGSRSQDPLKYFKDAAILEKALIEEPDNTRYVFYLAQSYKDAGMYEEAIKNYQKRISMGGWDQEIFWSWLQIARSQEALGLPQNVIVSAYEQAYRIRPSRAEPLYYLANYYRRAEEFAKGYETAHRGLAIPHSNELLFVEHWIYDYGLLLEFSICAYWSDKFTESLLSSHLILSKSEIPQNVRDCVVNNLFWINEKISNLNSSKVGYRCSPVPIPIAAPFCKNQSISVNMPIAAIAATF